MQPTVYRNGKIEQAAIGARAGEFGAGDLLVKNGDGGPKFVGPDYALKAGDALFVTQRGVAGV